MRLNPLEGRTKFTVVTKDNHHAVSAFLGLARSYFSDMPSASRENFIQSILDRQGELNRWLILLSYEDEHIGFVHMKINDERPGWGFILEFYIVPNKRGFG